MKSVIPGAKKCADISIAKAALCFFNSSQTNTSPTLIQINSPPILGISSSRIIEHGTPAKTLLDSGVIRLFATIIPIFSGDTGLA